MRKVRFVRGPASRAKSNRRRSGACFARPKQWGVAQGLASFAESNRPVGSLNLHDWCFRLAQRAPSLYRATEGSASEAADVETKRFGLSTAPSAAAESAFPEGAIASILRDASGGKLARLAGSSTTRSQSCAPGTVRPHSPSLFHSPEGPMIGRTPVTLKNSSENETSFEGRTSWKLRNSAKYMARRHRDEIAKRVRIGDP